MKKPARQQAIDIAAVQSRMLTIRNQQVLLDRDVAALYGVETKEINQAIRNNSGKFPELCLPKLPRLCYTIAVTTYNRLFEEAIENCGLVTTSMARKMGIEPGALVDLAYRGRLTRIGQGVYQLVQYAPGEKDPYAQAVALVGDGSYLYGESVIAMLGLAPTDPDRIYVATANRVRRNLGCGIKVVKSRPEYQPIAIEGIPSQRIQDAIVCAKPTMPSERLRAACKEAFRIGKIDEKERKRIEHEI